MNELTKVSTTRIPPRKTMNRKKNKEQRRVRPAKNVATHRETYIEIPRKSRAGIVYKRLKPVLTKIM